jgi:hypothetical protein
MSLKLVDYFDMLVDHGLQVIPLRADSKIPLCKGWNSESWSKEKTRDKLLRYPDSNLGILLGDIIDVEADSKRDDKLLSELIGCYPHPEYASTKSTHHLFLSPDQELRICTFQKMEFRGFGHQSVLPPSKHLGISYRWLDSARFPIPVMPPRLLHFYYKIKNRLQDSIKPNHTKVYCSCCGNKCFLHKRRLALELKAFQSMGMRWACYKCRTVDVRPVCRHLTPHAL